MLIAAFFSNKGIPAAGLTPTIRIREMISGNLVVTDEEMIESGDGFYVYDFTTYDEDEDYVIRADGVTLTGYDRYVYSTNQTAGVGKILQIEKGKWAIKGNQMIFYESDGTTPMYTFNLTTKNGSPTEKDVFTRAEV